jgi:hypothetical protein
MTKSISLLVLLIFISSISVCQSNNQQQKDCNISTGIGFGSITRNAKSAGRSFWLQLSYKLAQRFSIATEFENNNFKQPGYYSDLPVNPNEIKVSEDNFSLLIKYHFITNKNVKIAVASGWTFNVQQNDYYYFEKDLNSQHWFRNVTSSSDYSIPFLAEIFYPLFKNINIEARVRYNLERDNRGTYAAGIGLSLKL